MSTTIDMALTILASTVEKLDAKYWRDIKSNPLDRGEIMSKADVLQDVAREIRVEIGEAMERASA